MENESYDVIVCGTGLTECILSGLLSSEGKKVLQIDENEYYGGEGASLNLTALWKLFRPNEEYPKEYGANREWNIDLIPKFIMAAGKLVRILLKTRVHRYLEWKCCDATYVYQYKEGGMFSKSGGKIEKVPATAKEALSSDLMGLFEKRRCGKFMDFVNNLELDKPATWKGFDIKTQPFRDIAKKFELEPNTLDFIGHAVALYTTDEFLLAPAYGVLDKIKLYIDSIGRFGDSPFIYPIYGLGGIPEGFSRLSAVYGGTFMLNQSFKELIMEEGKFVGIKDGDKVAKAPILITSPVYMLKSGNAARVKSVGKVVRAICFLNAPLPNTKNAESIQVIIPQRQTGRKSDIFILMVSSVHAVSKKGYYIAIVSTNVETADPVKELEPAMSLLGPVIQKFVKVSDILVPVNRDVSDNVYITDSLDSTSHFESATHNVIELYKKITGKDLDLENIPQDDE